MSWAIWSPDPPAVGYWDPRLLWADGKGSIDQAGASRAGALRVIPASPAADAQALAAASFQPMFTADFYGRIHISLTTLSLGNVVGEQSRIVAVWNAHSYGVTLEQLNLLNGEGIELLGQQPPPINFGPLQERQWTLRVRAEGPPTIDARAVWVFSTGVQLQLTITGNRVSPWTWRPDWAAGIGESLEWLTDITESEEADEQRIGRRMTPRQTWEFSSTASGVERAAMEAAMIGWGARAWAVPLWPHGVDVQGVASGAVEVPMQTLGREFRAGGLAMFLGDSALRSEVVEVQDVQADRLVLRRPVANTWPSGAVLYPAKSARMLEPTIERYTGEASTASVSFIVAGPNPYSAAWDGATYQGMPVLEDRPDWSSAPVMAPSRKIAESDNMVGVPIWRDRSGYASLRQSIRMAPLGRVQLDRMRRLQYHMAGRLRGVWVPSFAQDFQLARLAAIGSLALDVEYSGFTAFVRGTPGREQLRIETPAGVFYRTITGSTDEGNGIERIGLDQPLPYTIDPAAEQYVAISFMSLMRSDSDRIEWAWWSGDHGQDSAHAETPMPMRTYRRDV